MGTNTKTVAASIGRQGDGLSTTRPASRAPARVLQILESLAEANDPMSLSALTTRLGVPKTSVMHLLRALEATSYVQRTLAGYQLGAASYRLATKFGAVNSFDHAAHPILQAMLEATRETILLGAFSEDRRSAVYTTSLPSMQAVRFAPQAGEHRPLYSTAVGKLLLAYAPKGFLDNYLTSVKMERITRKTVATRKSLREQLARIRGFGTAISIDEMADGGSALAAPVFERDGTVSTALVIAVPTSRMAAYRVTLERALREGGRKLSDLKGYTVPGQVSW